MKKDIDATISYWRDPGNGSPPDPAHDADLLLGHRDEENRKMLIRDIRGEESSFILDTHGFEVYTLPKRDPAADQDIDQDEYFKEIHDMLKKTFVESRSSAFRHARTNL